MIWYTYTLYNKDLNKFYIGFTNNLKRRLKEHRCKKTHTTSRMTGWKLVYYEACLSKRDAQKREKQLKTGFGRGYLKRRLVSYFAGVAQW